MKRYEDFEIWISPAPTNDDSSPHTVQVMSSPVGVASGELALNTEDEEFQRKVKLASSGGYDLDKRKEFGETLYKAIFHGEVGRVWSESLGRVDGDENIDGLRLRLHINVPRVAMLPWELLYGGGRQFFANSAKQALSRYLPVPEPARLRIRDRLCILLVVASPEGLETISEKEAKELQSAIKELDYECHLLYNESKKQIQGELQKEYHILHFLGHGKDGKLVLYGEDGKKEILTGEQFAQLVHGRSSHLRLVVLNACQSGQAMEEQLFSGIGPTLVQQRIAAVVAMQYETVDVKTAIDFSKELYRAVANELPVDVAVNEARSALSTGVKQDSREWSTPVLYMSTRSGRILDFVGDDEVNARQLQALAQESEEAKAALTQLQESLSTIKAHTNRLRDWRILERNLRELQSNADGLNKQVKDMARKPSGWEPRESDQNFLDLLWYQCARGITELDKEMSADNEFKEQIAGWREDLDNQRQQIDGLLAKYLNREVIAELNSIAPPFFREVSDQLNDARRSISDELNELRDLTLQLSSRFDMK